MTLNSPKGELQWGQTKAPLISASPPKPEGASKTYFFYATFLSQAFPWLSPAWDNAMAASPARSLNSVCGPLGSEILCSLGLHICPSPPNTQPLSHKVALVPLPQVCISLPCSPCSSTHSTSLKPSPTLQDDTLFLTPMPRQTQSSCKAEPKPRTGSGMHWVLRSLFEC